MTIACRYTEHHLRYKTCQESFVAEKTFRKCLPQNDQKRNSCNCFVYIQCPNNTLRMSDQLAGDRVRLNAFLRRCVKLGYRECTAPPAVLRTFLLLVMNSYFLRLAVIVYTFFNNLYLNGLSYSLRPRPHNKTLITKPSQLNDRDFIIRSIYKDSYWLHLTLPARILIVI